MRTSSPLRYPGGKSCLFELTSLLLRRNGLQHGHYAEPYAGGCGLALSLMYAGCVSEVFLNDVDYSIWSFWNAVFNQTEDLIERIMTTPVTVDEWQRQRGTHRSPEAYSDIEAGFAAFFLNRTNRSGVIKGGGVIGGLAQTGPYKIDCRFNKSDLSKRVARAAKYRERVHLTRLDGLAFIEKMRALPERSLLFIDPPYYHKGRGLYTSFYVDRDHEVLAKRVCEIETPWVVTYDDVPEVRSLYSGQSQFSFDLTYSLREKKKGKELMISSADLLMPLEQDRRQDDRRPRPLAA